MNNFTSRIAGKYGLVRRAGKLPMLIFQRMFALQSQQAPVSVQFSETVNNFFNRYLNSYFYMFNTLERIQSSHYDSRHTLNSIIENNKDLQKESRVFDTVRLLAQDGIYAANNIINRDSAGQVRQEMAGSRPSNMYRNIKHPVSVVQQNLASRQLFMRRISERTMNLLQNDSETENERDASNPTIRGFVEGHIRRHEERMSVGKIQLMPERLLSLQKKTADKGVVATDNLPVEHGVLIENRISNIQRVIREVSGSDLNGPVESLHYSLGDTAGTVGIINKETVSEGLKDAAGVFPGMVFRTPLSQSIASVSPVGMKRKSGVRQLMTETDVEDIVNKLNVQTTNIAVNENANTPAGLIYRKQASQQNMSESDSLSQSENSVTPLLKTGETAIGEVARKVKGKEIASIADKVYRIIEKRIEIEKDRRGIV